MSSQMPRERVDSYGAVDDVWAVRERVHGCDALAQRLRRAIDRGERLTLRGAGRSFHDQSQGDEVVLELRGLGGPARMHADVLVAGASTSIGELLDTATTAGRAIPSVVTGSDITLGGVLAASCISRGSAAYGRCGEGVTELVLMLADGSTRTLHRPPPGAPITAEQPFHAVLGGFGGLGVILEASQRTLALPWSGEPRVRTIGHPASSPADVIEPLLESLRRPVHDRGAAWRGQTDPTIVTPWAITHDEGRAIWFEHGLVDPATPLDPLRLHQPGSIVHQVGQWTASVEWTARHLPGLLYESVRQHARPFVDSLRGATFMMDGSVQASTLANRLGLRMGALQQSFALPVGVDARDSAPTLRFIERMLRALHDERVSASVIDLLPLPADEGLFSATVDGPALLVTPAIQHLSSARADRGRRVLERLSREALDLGGKVHLVKHVFAEPEVLEAMYGPALRRYAAIRATMDPEGVLASRFLDRLLDAVKLGADRRARWSARRSA